jgi:hypothetical protein
MVACERGKDGLFVKGNDNGDKASGLNKARSSSMAIL